MHHPYFVLSLCSQLPESHDRILVALYSVSPNRRAIRHDFEVVMRFKVSLPQYSIHSGALQRRRTWNMPPNTVLCEACQDALSGKRILNDFVRKQYGHFGQEGVLGTRQTELVRCYATKIVAQ